MHINANGDKGSFVQDICGSLLIKPVRWHSAWLNKLASWAPLRFIRHAGSCSIRTIGRGAQLVDEYGANPENAGGNNLIE